MGVSPQHIAIIMDGNGRWATRRGLPRAAGHRKGGEAVRRVVDGCIARGIPWLTLYAFSTENWGRPPEEVQGLMRMLNRFLQQTLPEMMQKGIQLRAIGELDMLPISCRNRLNSCLEKTKHNKNLVLTLALSYGSRQEITRAAQHLAVMVAEGRLTPSDITPDLFASQLDTVGMPDPDLLIRTSGEMRLSNYLLWQLSYAELWVTPVLWPDFGEEELDAALEDYAGRHRRYGKR